MKKIATAELPSTPSVFQSDDPLAGSINYNYPVASNVYSGTV
jgi:hypothetical protein